MKKTIFMGAMVIFLLGAALFFQNNDAVAKDAAEIGQCMGDCASEQGICISECMGDGQCIGRCAAAHGRCVARCN